MVDLLKMPSIFPGFDLDGLDGQDGGREKIVSGPEAAVEERIRPGIAGREVDESKCGIDSPGVCQTAAPPFFQASES